MSDDTRDRRKHNISEEPLSASPSPSPTTVQHDIQIQKTRNGNGNVHNQPKSPRIPLGPRRASSFAQPRPPGTPRTPNRVRFDVDGFQENGGPDAWLQQEDPIDGDDVEIHTAGHTGQRLPLLTGIEAPSITAADDFDFNAEDLLESARPKSGILSAFMNLTNSIIGAGIIGQPYAFRQAGLLTGILLLIVLTITVDWTIRLIVINSKLSGSGSFQATVEKCFGKSGLVAISLAQFMFAFGGCVAFCVIIGDTIPHVMAALFPSLSSKPFLWLLTDRRCVIIVLVLGVSLPLSLYRDISKLAKASSLALLSMLVIVVTVITQGPRTPITSRGPIKGSLWINDGIFQAIGVISFAFVCHHNSLLIYGSLKKPTIDRFTKLTHYSTGISMLACMAMALAGFLTFGNQTKGNVLNNFPTDNVLVNIARALFGFNMLTTLPLECFVCREVLENYYFPHERFNPNRHLIFTTTLVFSAMTMALITCDLGALFELIGATSACALAYILPPLCWIKLTKHRGWQVLPAYACVAFGCSVMFISLFQTGFKMFRRDSGDGGTCG